MLIDYVTFPDYSIWMFIGFVFVNWFTFLKPVCRSFFDPLNLSANLTLSGSLTVYFSMLIEGVLLSENAWYVPVSIYLMIFTIWSFRFINNSLFFRTIDSKVNSCKARNFTVTWLIGLLFFAIFTFAFISKFGIPALYDNPLIAKMMFSEGSGSYRRIIQVSSLFVQVTSVIAFTRHNNGFGIFTFLLASIVISVLVVSKSALISQTFMLIFLLDSFNDRRLQKYLYPFFPFAAVFSFWLMYAAIKSVVPNAGFDRVLHMFTTRVIAYGDAVFYLLSSVKVEAAFQKDDLITLVQTNFAPLLAPLRIISWDDALSTGGRIYAEIVGKYSGIGPNAFPPVEGWLYLNWFGILYCELVTLTVMLFRRVIFSAVITDNAYLSFIGCSCFLGVTNFFVDGAYWGTMLITFMISVLYCVAILSATWITIILLRTSLSIKKPFYISAPRRS